MPLLYSIQLKALERGIILLNADVKIQLLCVLKKVPDKAAVFVEWFLELIYRISYSFPGNYSFLNLEI